MTRYIPNWQQRPQKVGTWCRTLLELGCEIGWGRNVWVNLKVKDVDVLNCRITLPGMLSKNKEPYVAYSEQGSNLYRRTANPAASKRRHRGALVPREKARNLRRGPDPDEYQVRSNVNDAYDQTQ
jgi:hypothetical protein